MKIQQPASSYFELALESVATEYSSTKLIVENSSTKLEVLVTECSAARHPRLVGQGH